MSVVIIVGVQWGDEGKGKIVDCLTERADVVVRFQGGNNAGHTVVVNGVKTALSLIPSGILHPNSRCLLASGVIINPSAFFDEIERLGKAGVAVTPERLGIAAEVQLIMPYHIAIDKAREDACAGSKIGTTGKGIGPAYEYSVSRSGIRIVDLMFPDVLKSKLEKTVKDVNIYLEAVLGSSTKFEVSSLFDDLMKYAERLKPFMTNVSKEIDVAIRQNKNVIFEGAQGTLLDVLHGTYPYVTSSNTVAGYACVSAGIGPKNINSVIGICKAYCTRVGSGPFPSEDLGRDGEVLRTAGNEFGTVTGRPRRCGWFDAIAMRRAIRLNGVDMLIVTKLDVLTGFDAIKIAVGYKLDGQLIDDFPASCKDLERVEVVSEELAGWKEDITGVLSFDELPKNAQIVLNRIQDVTECHVAGFSVGPDREQTVMTDRLLKTLTERQ